MYKLYRQFSLNHYHTVRDNYAVKTSESRWAYLDLIRSFCVYTLGAQEVTTNGMYGLP